MSAPPPVITTLDTVDVWPAEWYPRSPRAFLAVALEAGWSAKMAFCRGYVAGQKADTWDLRDQIAVWLDGYGKRAVMIWERNPDAEFTAKKLDTGIKLGEIPSGYKWSPKGGSIMLGKGMSFPWLNSTQMTEWTKLRGDVLPSWYEGIKNSYFKTQAEAAERNKARAESERKAKEEAASLSAREGVA